MKSGTCLPVLFLILAIATLFHMGGCRRGDGSPVIARVGSSVLTLKELHRSIPPEYSGRISREQRIYYVKQWIDNEVLFREALRQHIDREPSIKSRLAKMKKDLLCAELISRNALSSQDVPISGAMISRYYEKNKERFIREHDVVKYLQIVVENVKTAWRVREKVTAHNFLDLASKHSIIPVQDPRTVPYIPFTELPPKIAQIVAKIRVGGTTSPIKTPGGYHIIRILDKQKKGSICRLDEAKEEIINELSTQTQKAELERFLSSLRVKADIEKNFELIPGEERFSQSQPPAESAE